METDKKEPHSTSKRIRRLMILSLSLLKEGAQAPQETEVGHLVTRVNIGMDVTIKIYIYNSAWVQLCKYILYCL